MAEQQNDLKIVIEAVNNASGQIKQVEKDLGGLSSSVAKDTTAFTGLGDKAGFAMRSYQQHMKSFDLSLDQLNKDLSSTSAPARTFGEAIGGISMASVTAALKLAGVTLSLALLTKELKEALQVAGKMETVLLGLSATARMFGEDSKKARDASKSLTEDGLINQIQAAEGLQEIMYTGLGLEEATKLMGRFKDMAAFGGKNTIEYTEKLRMLFESFRTGYSIQAKNAGLMMTWNEVMEIGAKKLGKKADMLTKAEEAEAKYLGLMEITAGQEGQSALLTTTYAGSVSRLKDAKIELMNTLGQGLQPAMIAFNNILADVIEKMAGLKVITQAIGTVFQALQYIAKEVGNFISGTVASIIASWQILIEEASRLTLNPKSWFEAGKSAVQRLGEETTQIWKVVGEDAQSITSETWAGLKETWGKGTGDITDVVKKANLDWMNATSEAAQKAEEALAKALKKMNEDLAKENANYTREVAKRAKVFSDTFDDLVISHRDKIKKLTSDLATESRDYNSKLLDLLDNYNQAMEDIEARHKKKTESVMEDMEDERKKALEEIEKITEAYNEEVSLIQKEGEDRLSNLKAQLAREKALGAMANADKIAALEQMIAYEESGLASSLEEKKAKYDEEVADVNEALDDRLEKIKKTLAEEDTAYADSYAKRKVQYAEDVADAKTAYEDKRIALQAELDAEVVIRAKYEEDFKRVGDRIALDDITRLVNKNNEEKIEYERQHKERLAEIEKTAFEAGVATTTKMAEGIEAGTPVFQQKLNQIKSDINQAIGVMDNFTQKAGQMGDFYTPQNYPGNYPYYGQKGGIFSKPTMVGEAGAEVV